MTQPASPDDPNNHRKLSRFLSLLLRHRPEVAGLQLDAAGWVSIDDLLAGLARCGHHCTPAQLAHLVAHNDKQRFQCDPSATRIRAVQGHSVAVDLGYPMATPPDTLWHGTATNQLASIRQQGLRRMRRHHVHLHADAEVAAAVGKRHGTPVVLRVHAADMVAAGFQFYQAPNGVWLTDHVPPAFLVITA
jgi:putative RNA 2'-phosphotransferase